MQVKFTVPGEPQGKGRPRATGRGNKIHVFTPKKTADYEKVVRQIALFTNNRLSGYEGVVRMEITAFCGIPKSWGKKKQNAAELCQVYPLKVPDIDNIAKIILDGLNGYLFKDDKQVCDLIIRKRYAVNPRVEITLKYGF